MNKMHWKTVVAAVLISGTSFGAGFQLYTEGSAEALGQAGAISGRDDLISLAWYNPAALAGAKQASIMLGGTLVQLKTDYTGPGTPASMSDEWRPVPHVYYVQPLSDAWTTTFSINAPYGLISEWPEGWALAAMATYSELQAIYLTPSIAYQLSDAFSLSAGVNVVSAKAELAQTGVALEGDDLSYGGTLAAHIQFLDDWGLGARYQSPVDLKFEGEINGALPAVASLTLPATTTIGIANASMPHLSLGLDLVWTEWSSYDYLTVNGSATPKLWKDVWSIRLGGEYALSERWVFRGGYVWDQSPVPDTTRAPEMPGSDRQMITTGLGWSGASLGFDVAYSYLWAKTAELGTSFTPFTGSFETITHLIALSARYAF